MVDLRPHVVVKYNRKEKQFDLNKVASLELPEEKEEKLNQLFNDFSNETAFKRLSNDTFVKASLILLIVFILLLVFFVVIQTFSPTKHIVTELIQDNPAQDTPDTTNSEGERRLAGAGGNSNIEIEHASPVVFEVFIFLTTYMIVLLLIALTIQQILIKNLVNRIDVYEKETINIYAQHFKDHLLIEPRRRRKSILRMFKCFNVFEFSYKLIIPTEADIEEKNISDRSTGDLDPSEDKNSKDSLEFITS